MTIPLAASALTFVLTLALGFPFLVVLRRAGVAKLVRADELETHLEKTGTPTMGGLLFVLTIVVMTSVSLFGVYREMGRSILLPLSVLVAVALLGAYDDRMSLVGGRGGGLSVRAKFLLLLLIGLVAAIVLANPSFGLGINFVYLPGVRESLSIGWLIGPLALVAILGTAHAVNLTDGL